MIRIITIRSCLILLISLLFWSTAVLPVDAKKKSIDKNDKKIRIKIIKMTKYDVNLLGEKLKHPGNFKVEGIKKALKPIRYRERALFTGGKRKLIFRGKTIHQFALLVHKALLEVKPDSKVSFSVSSSTGKTAGDIFALNDSIIFKFDIINGTPYINEPGTETEEIAVEANIQTNWLLVPGKGQQLYAYEGLLGWDITEKTMIMANLVKYKGKAVVVESGENKDIKPQYKKKTIEDKLRFLKELKNKNLISSDAYEKKVQDLLDKF